MHAGWNNLITCTCSPPMSPHSGTTPTICPLFLSTSMYDNTNNNMHVLRPLGRISFPACISHREKNIAHSPLLPELAAELRLDGGTPKHRYAQGHGRSCAPCKRGDVHDRPGRGSWKQGTTHGEAGQTKGRREAPSRRNKEAG